MEWPISPNHKQMFHQEALDRHNMYRAMHGVPPLVLNDKLSAAATQLALVNYKLLRQGKELTFSPRPAMYGESVDVFYKVSNLEAARVVDIWYEKGKTYDFGRDYEPEVSYFLQMVWKSTKQLGVGVARGHHAIVFACTYHPKADFDSPLNTLEQNVFVKSLAVDMPSREKSIKDRLLSCINSYREAHGAGPLKLNLQLSELAESYAQDFLQEKILPIPSSIRNIIISFPGSINDFSIEKLIEDIYKEIRNYDFYSMPEIKRGKKDLLRAMQIIWKSTTDLGIGYGSDFRGKESILVLLFSPSLTYQWRTENLFPKGTQYMPNPRIEKAFEWPEGLQERKQYYNGILSEHNKYRKNHGAPPLQIKNELTIVATEWAKKLARDLSITRSSALPKVPRKFGINLALISEANNNPQKTVAEWYNGIDFYDYGNPEITEANRCFTTLVWKNSTNIGIGTAKHGSLILLCCHYQPVGNDPIRLLDNILPINTVYNPQETLQPMRFRKDFLIHVNYLRAAHGVPPLLGSSQLDRNAQETADNLEMEDLIEGDISYISESGKIIITMRCRNKPPEVELVIQNIYKNIEFYDYFLAKCLHTEEKDDPRSAMQLIWKNNQELGVGLRYNEDQAVVVIIFLPGVIKEPFGLNIFPRNGIKDYNSEYVADVLDYINIHRAAHRALPLKLNQQMSSLAEDWAKELAKRQTNIVTKIPNIPYGQEISYFLKDPPCAESFVTNLYNSIDEHDFETNAAEVHSTTAKQMLSKNCKELGIGRARIQLRSVLVLFYFPRGNEGSFKGITPSRKSASVKNLIQNMIAEKKVAKESLRNSVPAGMPSIKIIESEDSIEEVNVRSSENLETAQIIPELRTRADSLKTPSFSFQTECVKLINLYRAQHGAPDLRMDRKLTKIAEETAWLLVKNPKDSSFEEANINYAFNITFWPNGLPAPEDYVDHRYSKVKEYNFTEDVENVAVLSGLLLIWKCTRTIGISYAQLKAAPGYAFVIAVSHPKGLWKNQFKRNIYPKGTPYVPFNKTVFENRTLSYVNKMREIHGAPPLLIDPQLTAAGEEYASLLLRNPKDGSVFKKYPHFSFHTEYSYSLHMTAEEYIKLQEKALQKYNFSNHTYNNRKTEIAVELIWKDCRTFGIGIAEKEDMVFGLVVIIVTVLHPKGLWVGQFHKNVFPAGTEYFVNKPFNIQEFAMETLELINKLRVSHGVPPLKLDPKLNKMAQTCVKAHVKQAIEKSCEENLCNVSTDVFILYGSEPTAREYVEARYKQLRGYDFSRGMIRKKALTAVLLIWKGFKFLGIGYAHDAFTAKTAILTLTGPARLVTDSFKDNVFEIVSVKPTAQPGAYYNFASDCLEHINVYRKMHGAPPLRINQKLSQEAQKIAQVLVRDPDNEQYMNEYINYDVLVKKWSSAQSSEAKSFVDSLYESILKYNFATGEGLDEAFSATLIIWYSTIDLGAAMTKSGNIIVGVLVFNPKCSNGWCRENVLPKGTVFIPRLPRLEPFQWPENTDDFLRFEKEILHRHNIYRERHNAPPLKLNTDVSKISMELAKHLAKNGNINRFHNSDSKDNIYFSEGRPPLAMDIVTSWYTEIRLSSVNLAGFTETLAHDLAFFSEQTSELGVGVCRWKNNVAVVCSYHAHADAVKSLEQISEVPEVKRRIETEVHQRINHLRENHGVAPLMLSPDLTADAEKFVNYIFEGNMEISKSHPKYGLLIHQFENQSITTSFIDDCYEEIGGYNFSTGVVENKNSLNGLQLIWKNTKNLGLCYKYDSSVEKHILVILFYPKGLNMDFAKKNLFPKGTPYTPTEPIDNVVFEQQSLELINNCRKNHGVPPLKLSLRLSELAQKLAEHCVQNPRNRLLDETHERYGMILTFEKDAPLTAALFVDESYNQIQYYNFSSGKYSRQNTADGLALIWKSTKELGIGYGDDEQNDVRVAVALFHPKGLIEGSYRDNLFPKGTQLVLDYSEEDRNLYKRKILDRHNYYRKLHNSPPLKIDDNMSKLALEWAKKLVEKSELEAKVRPNLPFGQEIAIFKRKIPTGKQYTDIVYSHLNGFDFNKEPETNTYALKATQIIWRKTTELGVGISKSNHGAAIVIFYHPKGNIKGKFLENVIPKESDETFNKVQYEQDILMNINRRRAVDGYEPLTINKNISILAQEWAEVLTNSSYSTFQERPESLYHQIGWIFVGEFPLAEEFVNSHYQNITEDNLYHAEMDKKLQNAEQRQAIWKNTKDLGLGFAQKDSKRVIVFMYHSRKSPAEVIGVGAFASDPPLKTEKLPDLIKFKDDVLHRINHYREIHGVPFLEKSASLNSLAQKRAQSHISNESVTTNIPYGEEVFRAVDGLPNASNFVDSIYVHILDNDLETEISEGGVSEALQMIWRNASKMGIGAVERDNASVIVLLYHPKGKMSVQSEADQFPVGKAEADNQTIEHMKFEQDMLVHHNDIRALHHVTPFTINPKLTELAQNYAEELAKDGKKLDEKFSRREKDYGRNIFVCDNCLPLSALDIVNAWYKSILQYDFITTRHTPESLRATQIIWRSSKEIGVGYTTANAQTYVVVFYAPPGNVTGEFAANVSPTRDKTTQDASESITKTEKNLCQDCSEYEITQNILETHNYYRDMHGVPQLRFNENMAKSALEWATALASRHTLEFAEHYQYAQNIVRRRSEKTNGFDIVHCWYSQINKYNFATGLYVRAAAGFTQMIWKGTTDIGVGVVKKDGNVIIVVFYHPPGNINGEFLNNVPPKLPFVQLEAMPSWFRKERKKPIPDCPTLNIELLSTRARRSKEAILQARVQGALNGDQLKKFQNECLHVHNKLRALHATPPLRLNHTLNEKATEWALHLAREGKLISHEQTYGENTYKFLQKKTATQIVKAWYNQIEHYNFDSPAFDVSTGAFTQVIWKKSTDLGVGVAQGNRLTFVVAFYDPAGNYDGEYTNNVLPLVDPQALLNESVLTKITGPTKDESNIEWKMKFLKISNEYRDKHGVPKLQLVDFLSQLAWQTALYILGGEVELSTHIDYGTNLYEAWDSNVTPENVLKHWYQQISKYSYQVSEMEKIYPTENFTQMIWKATRQVGVAKITRLNYTLVVAIYFPSGNHKGYFKENVLPPLNPAQNSSSLYKRSRSWVSSFWSPQ